MGSANFVHISSEIPLGTSVAGATSRTDAESALRLTTGADGIMSGDGSQAFVRRPTRGVQLKKEVFAVLTVSGGAPIKNSSRDPNQHPAFTSNFLLQSVQETRAEKFQPVTTFGAPYGFFFGEQPRMVSCSAVLLNTADFQWEAEWWENYDQHMRGTRLVDKGARVSLTYEDVLIEGYMIQASTSKGEPNPSIVSLSFTLWVTGVTYLIDVGATVVDAFHVQDQNLSEWSSTQQGGEDGSLDVESMTETVRSRNIQALSDKPDVGLVSAIFGAITDAASFNSFTGAAGASIGAARDWLYGRSLVVPVGFAGSERTAGFVEFASGSGSAALLISGDTVSVTEASVTLRAPVRVMAAPPKMKSFYESNVDEYPSRFAEIVPPAHTFVDTTDPSLAYATAMFENFGIDVSTPGESADAGDVMRLIALASFATVAFAATLVDAQDTAASLATASSTDKVRAANAAAAARTG